MAGKQRLVRDPDAVGVQQTFEEEPVLTGAETGQGRIFRGDEAPSTPAPVEGDIWIDTTGGAPYQHKTFVDAAWVLTPLIEKDGGGVVIARVELGATPGEVQIAGAGPISINAGTGACVIEMGVDGTLAIKGATGLGKFEVFDDGSSRFGSDAFGYGLIDAAGLQYGDFLAKVAGGIWLNLPGADPVVAGQLWDDTGTVKVSAG